MIEKKKELRRKFRALRNSIDETVRENESLKIASALFETDEYKKAETVFVYVSFGSEVGTKEIINRALKDGKRVAVPLCNVEAKTMSAVLIEDISCLMAGAYGIPEPENSSTTAEKDEIDLVIVPALSFDKSRARLGYGGGYYDKFLENYKGSSVGLCFSECLADKLPTEKYDCRVDRVICPEGMI